MKVIFTVLLERFFGAARLERKSFFLWLEKIGQKKDWERKAEKAAIKNLNFIVTLSV